LRPGRQYSLASFDCGGGKRQKDKQNAEEKSCLWGKKVFAQTCIARQERGIVDEPWSSRDNEGVQSYWRGKRRERIKK